MAASSFFQSSYLAQALKRQLVRRDAGRLAAAFLTKIGPKSRVQPRLVGTMKKSTAARFAPLFSGCGGALASLVAVLHQDAHALDAREMAHDVGIDPGNRREFAGPVGALVRPGEPGGFVRLPFGGHAVALSAGSVQTGLARVALRRSSIEPRSRAGA